MALKKIGRLKEIGNIYTGHHFNHPEAQKNYERALADAEMYRQQAQQASSPLGLAWNAIKGLPSTISNIPSAISGGLTRASSGIENFRQSTGPKLERYFTQLGNETPKQKFAQIGRTIHKFQGTATNFLTGENIGELKNQLNESENPEQKLLSQRMKEIEKEQQKLGGILGFGTKDKNKSNKLRDEYIKLSQSYDKSLNPEQKDIHKKIASASINATIGFMGGEERNAINDIVKSKSAREIIGNLKHFNIADDVVKDIAPKLTEINDPNLVGKIIKNSQIITNIEKETGIKTTPAIRSKIGEILDNAIINDKNQAETLTKNITKDAIDSAPKPIPKTLKIHPEDQQKMIDFIDYVRLRKKENLPLELDASRIAEHYGIKMPKTRAGLANEFDKTLSKIKQSGVKTIIKKTAKKIVKPLDTTGKKGLRAVGLAEKTPRVVRNETTLLKNRVRALARGYREGRVMTKMEIKANQEELSGLIKNSKLELKDKAKFINRIKNTQTNEQLKKILPKIQERVSVLEEASKKRNLLNQIGKELKEPLTRKAGNERVSKYSPEITNRLKEYKASTSFKDPESLRMKKLKITSKWYAEHPNEYLPDKVVNQLQELDRTHLKLLKPDELEQQLKDIQSLKTQGKTYNRIVREQTKRERKKIIESFNKILTGGKPIEKTVVPEHKNIIKRALKKLKVFHWHNLNSDNLFDILDEATKDKPYTGKIHNYFQRVVNKARDVKINYANEKYTEVKNELKKLGLNKDLLKTEKIDNIKLSRADMIEIYSSSKDKAKLDSLIYGNKLSPDLIEKITKGLTPKEKAFGDFLVDFHERNYAPINEVFRKENFMDMPKNKGYSPMHKDLRFTQDENVNLAKNALEYAKASVSKGMTKARSGSLAPIKIDLLGNLVNDIERNAHYIAFELPTKEMNAVLRGTKDAVISKYGPEYYDVLRTWLKRTAGDGRFDATKLSKQLLKLRTGLTKSLIANFITPLKQTISLSSFLTEMNGKDLISGVSDYTLHKGKWDKFWDKIPQIANRSETLTRDIGAISKTRGAFRTLEGKKQISELGVEPVRFFDRLTTRSGATAMYKKSLKEGLTKEQALEKTLGVVRRTQPTGDIKDLSALQSGGPLEKLMTMFMNQPNKYYNILTNNLRAYSKGRVGKAQLGRAILYAWVVPSIVFEEASKGGKATKEDLVKSTILGPLNDVLILGNLFQGIRSGFDYSASPIEGLAKDFSNSMVKLSKGEMLKSMYDLTKIAAQTKGIPTSQPERTIKGLMDITSGNSTDWRRLIWSKYALGENRRNVAESYLKKFSKLGANGANKKLKELRAKNPKMAKEIMSVYKDKKLGITDSDYKLKKLRVDERANKIIRQLNSAKNKKKFWNDYVKKGIITKEVAKKIREKLKK